MCMHRTNSCCCIAETNIIVRQLYSDFKTKLKKIESKEKSLKKKKKESLSLRTPRKEASYFSPIFNLKYETFNPHLLFPLKKGKQDKTAVFQ